MRAEVNESYVKSYRLPLFNLRWSAVLAGLVVGVTSELVLLLLGAAVGLGYINAGARASEEGLLFAASLWNGFAMVTAAVIGGYIAARASGMRRTADGVLHGVLAWGVAMLTLLVLATSTAGTVLVEMFDSASRPAAAENVRPLDDAEREAVLDILVDRLGISGAQADVIADQIQVPTGRRREARTDGEARQALHAASMLSGWLSIAILLSLVGAIGGGILGSRGMRRVVSGDLRYPPPPDAANDAGDIDSRGAQ